MLGIATGAALAAGGGTAAGGLGLGSFIGPAIGFAGSLMGDIFGSSSQAATNAAQMQMMQQNEQWQEHMSDTQMQRRVADLKAAGLNPMLAVNTPGAAMPSFQQPNLQAPGAAFGNLGPQLSQAIQTAQIGSQIDQMRAQTGLMQAQRDKTAGADTDEARARIDVDNMQSRLLGPAQAKAANAAAQLDEASQDRVRQQINSGDIAQSIKLMQQQSGLARAQQYMDIAMGKFNDMSAIEKQFAMPLMIQQLGLGIQNSILGLPEKRAFAQYMETRFGQLSFAQDQASRGIGTALDVYKAFKPGVSVDTNINPPRSSGFPGDFGGQFPPLSR